MAFGEIENATAIFSKSFFFGVDEVEAPPTAKCETKTCRIAMSAMRKPPPVSGRYQIG